MVDGVSMHRSHDAPLISDPGHMGDQLTHPLPALAMLSELKNVRSDREFRLPRGHGGQALPLANRGRQILPTLRFEMRFGVEQLHLRRSTRLEQIDDPLGLRRCVDERRSDRRTLRSRSSSSCKGPERRRTEGARRAVQKIATTDGQGDGLDGVEIRHEQSSRQSEPNARGPHIRK